MHLEPLYLYLYVQKNRIEDLEAARYGLHRVRRVLHICPDACT